MAAYGAAISLKNTIQLILKSPRISLVPPSPQIIQPAYDAMCRLQKALLKLDSTGYSKIRMNVNSLDERIKEFIWEFEDLLESLFTNQILPKLESKRDHLSFSVDLQSLRLNVDHFVYRVMEMEMAYDIELRYMSEEEGEPLSSRIDFAGINSNMVGLSDQFEKIKDYLFGEDESGGNWVSIVGMAGVGKTTLAKKVFDDPTIRRNFELRAWVKVGKKCESNETLRCILAQLDPNTRHQMLTQGFVGDDKKLVGLFDERLKGRKCLIVLDDVWDRRVMYNLLTSRLGNRENVRVLLTSRLWSEKYPCVRVRLLDEDESRKLLCKKVFGEENFPPQLKELGKKITKKCEGLPLMIVTVAELLSKEDKTPKYWTEVAVKQNNLVFMDAYNQISEFPFSVSVLNWEMAAYGAAVSLKNTIESLLQSSRILLIPPSPQILQSAYDAMCCLQKVLLKLDETSCSKIRTKVNDLDERIKEAVWEFEDLLESHYTNQILPHLERSSGGERDRLSFSVDMHSLRQSVDCFIERVTVMEAEYDMELLNMPEEEDEPLSLRIDFRGINSNMVGLSDHFEKVRDYLIENEGNQLLITGMAGVGKTTFVKKVFVDPSIQIHFELRAWVKVGRKCESNETLRCILAQVDPSTRNQMLAQRDDKKLLQLLKERLKDKKCLVVLDDVWKWDTQLMDSLRKKNVQILLTSRLRIQNSPISLELCLLNKKESKKLLGEKVFGEKGFPLHLEELGEKIAEKCEGLPLMIVTVASLLRKANESNREELDKTIHKYWTEVAETQHNSIFVDAYDQIAEVLFPSYEYSPQYLKMFFLYLGAFVPYRNILLHMNLICCISAEGFLEPPGTQILKEKGFEHVVSCCLEVLAKHFNLLLWNPERLSWFSNGDCRVHSCWQHLCRKEASKIKFLHVLQSCNEDMKGHRRLCVHSNTLFAIKQVYDSIKSDCPSTVRSLLCYGPFHPYPVPLHAMDCKSLRVLHAFMVRFYQIQPEILKLVCLKYLALTCNTELPASISNLLHLQFLIINPYVHIIKRGVLPYMPMEIWDMQNLQVINVKGRDIATH
ncbi:putative disease resistance protein At1g50180 [Salvia splendens]|uniref:putative disease resistance protein At1g50180 n=1 Tax=Salvia splendens TaxID=180675 RepID=UPI001C2714A9|nr:putative disease resistance protein At1g50180 [Salvia splendens]